MLKSRSGEENRYRGWQDHHGAEDGVGQAQVRNGYEGVAKV